MSDTTDTIEYHIYEHRDGEDCGESMAGGRAVDTRHDGFTEDNEPPCSGVHCDKDLVYQRTIEVDNTLPKPPEFRREFIVGLSDYERALMLGMAMESIRGSWSSLEYRLGIIGYICDIGVGDQLSDEFIDRTKGTAKALWRKRRVNYLYPDGRTFRGNSDGRYGKLWDEIEKDVKKMRPMASHLTNDKTWNAWKFDKLEENTDDG